MTFRADFEHRDDLLRAAIDEFGARSYEAASLNRVLSASGVSKGQLYHHFTNKQGLYLALVEWMIDTKAAWFVEHPPELRDDFFADFEAQLRASVAFAAAHPDVERLSRALLAERGQPIFAEVRERFAFDGESPLAQLVARSHARGQFGNDVSLPFAQRIVLVMVNDLAEIVDLREPAELDAHVDELLAFLRRGLGRH
jgi:AcrR family transcriptional regulator